MRLFEWDYLNRLVAVTDFDSSGNVVQIVEFSYDMFGQRRSKVVDGVATYFVYDRDDVILDFVDDGSGIELDMRYLHGNQVDQVLAQEDSNGDVVWLLRDYLGTIRDLVDNTGDVVNHLTYDSYGNVVSETDASVDSRYRFTGREWDEEIELYYYRTRYYSAESGRFISVDPISFKSGTYNLYGYVDNSPISNVDPSGLASKELTDLLGRFKPVNKGGTVYHSKKEYSDYSKAYIEAQNSFFMIIDYVKSSGFLRSPKVPPNIWYLNGLLKVNGDYVNNRYKHLEGGQSSLRPGGVTGPIPTIDLQKQRIKTSSGNIETRHYTRGYENATELKFIWKNYNKMCIIMPAKPQPPTGNNSTNNNNQQPAPSPTFQLPPMPPIPRWLNPFGNPNPRF
ncbi:RHS repeat-associated core domain-containing protein [Cyanobacterium aponinum UTEX 3222]|uniref:RHS repeat domain-containing protein n=1 Tax=Cyanobacterium aponinum TaxID=379064 RepID=UPI002B4BDE37|nr:RHS repeat-associated core domain-containing protein [Cyanobacterium aponinum]WRL38028.1 RHS repeat-associated core domain-containing protein [Cyanobacterium aponinum UTEX 3221]WRL41490.1 RHS repeat-associated core domain-containing protein [Cyanobacterium aponinum UTEX 3222]